MSHSSSKKSRSRRRRTLARGGKRGISYQQAVAEVARTLEPNASVQVGVWTEGPDGLRDLDVRIRRTNGELIVIECKDWTRPIGIALVDALESKRRDIGASVAMICSNSGFTDQALHKAARVGIPALAALIRGDSRIRVVVKEQIFTRKVRFGQTQSLIRHGGIDERVPDRDTVTPEDFSYQHRPVLKWLGSKLFLIASAAVDSRSLTAAYSLQPITLQVRGIDVVATTIEVKTSFVVEWWTQVAQIDASTGMYDYLRRRIILGPTPSQFHTTLDTQSWGRQIAREEVPERYLTWPAQQPGSNQGPEMRFGLFENFPFGGDLNGGPDLDPFVTNEAIKDEPEGGSLMPPG